MGLDEPDFDFVTEWIERIETAGRDFKDTTAGVASLTELSKLRTKPSLGWIERNTIRL